MASGFEDWSVKDPELCRFAVLVKVFEPGTFNLLYRLEPARCIRELGHPGLHVVPNVATKEGK